MVSAAVSAEQISVFTVPSPMQTQAPAVLVLSDSHCADPKLVSTISDHGEARRVVFDALDYCILYGIAGSTQVQLGTLDPGVRTVQLIGCSFGPPGRYYCVQIRELAVQPTLFSNGFDVLRYQIDP